MIIKSAERRFFVFKWNLIMIKILVPILLVLFLNNVAAEVLDTLDQDLKLLKSNLLLLSDKIALDEDDLAMLGHIDVLMLEVEGVIEGLGSKRFRYEGDFSEAEKIRVKIQWNRSDAELNKKSLSKEGISRLSRLENKAKEDLVNNKQYLYDSVACSDDYSLSEWRALSNRKFKAIRCTIERNKDQIYSLYKN